VRLPTSATFRVGAIHESPLRASPLRTLAIVFAILWAVAPALAQETPPPTGPAQIINRSGEARQQAQLRNSPAQTAAAPEAASPTAPSPAAASPQAGHDPHAGVDGAPPVDRLPMNSAIENPELRPGTIRVRVLDGADQSVAKARVQLGVMAGMGARTTVDGVTDDAGVAVFAGLAVGEGQAYRVNVLHEGAKYSSNPFRLPVSAGYDVMVRQLDTTRDTTEVVLYIGATSVELHDERLKIVQQARLVNVGQRTYVFPENGQIIPLPPGFLAFSAQDTMTDQKVTPVDGKGLRIDGSLAPGQATLTWGFDLPRDGSEASFSIPIPWRNYAYRVLADAAQGMTMEVDGMPPPQLVEHDGHRLLVTETQAQPNQPMLKQVSIRLHGIPGAGPARWVALSLALLGLAVGLSAAFRRDSGESTERATTDRKRELALAVARLDREFAAGDVGPDFHNEERTRLIDELSSLLREESAVASAR